MVSYATMPGFEIIPELAPRPTEGVFDKLMMSAFEGTWLDFALRDCGISAFIIVGVATEIGIEPTARHGADLGYIPVIVTDACGAGNEEAANALDRKLEVYGRRFDYRHRDDLPDSPKVIRHSDHINFNHTRGKKFFSHDLTCSEISPL